MTNQELIQYIHNSVLVIKKKETFTEYDNGYLEALQDIEEFIYESKSMS